MSAQTNRSVPLQNLRQHLASNRSLARLLTYHQRRELARRQLTPAELAADFERRHRIAAAKLAAATAATPRFMFRKTPLGLADARRVARAIGVRKLTPTELGVLGFVRRAVSSGKSGLWLSQCDLARRLNCHPESVRRAERRLERLELVVRVPQYHEQPALHPRSKELLRSVRMPSVLVLGPVGRQWCAPSRVRKPAAASSARSTRRAPAARRSAPSKGGYNLWGVKDLPSGSVPEGRESRGDSGAPPAAPPSSRAVSPSETGSGRLTAASVERASDAGDREARILASAGSGAFGEGEGAAASGRPPPGTAPLARWAALCPDFAASGERGDGHPESPPGEACRSRRGEP